MNLSIQQWNSHKVTDDSSPCSSEFSREGRNCSASGRLGSHRSVNQVPDGSDSIWGLKVGFSGITLVCSLIVRAARWSRMSTSQAHVHWKYALKNVITSCSDGNISPEQPHSHRGTEYRAPLLICQGYFSVQRQKLLDFCGKWQKTCVTMN